MKKSKKLFVPVLVSVVIFLAGTYFLGKASGGSFVKSVFAERDSRDNDSRDNDSKSDNRKKITVPRSEKNKEESKKEETKKEEVKKEETKKEEVRKEETKKEEVKKEETNEEEAKKEETKKEEVKKEETKKEEVKKEETKKEEVKEEETKRQETKKEEVKKEETKRQETKKEEVKEKKVTIETQDDTANKVEFYIKKEEGDQDVYLGKAEKNSENDNWELDVNVDERIPNGDYVINAEIEDEEGTWKSEEVKVQVDLGPSSEATGRAGEAGKEEKKRNDFANDWDMDGISDEEEARLGTDPYSADSDQDGYLDSDEVKNGFDPLKFSPGDKSDKITFEEPKENGDVSDKYDVKEVKQQEDSETGQKKISFSGKALPNSFVTLYIYSEKPIIVTVKTDADGNWAYDLDKELENGDHEVYVAVTDNTGKVTAKSSPLKFVKTAQAVEFEPIANSNSPLEQERTYMLAYGVAIIVTVISLALVIISIVVKKKPDGNKELN